MQEGKLIRGLREQVKYTLIPRQYNEQGVVIERECTYTADFVYEEWSANGWRTIVEDVKGYPNDRWSIKRKLMLFVHGHKVRET